MILIPAIRRLFINSEAGSVYLKRCLVVCSGNQFAKKELPFTYERPVRELQIFKSGDTKELIPLAETRPILKFVGLEDEIKKASPNVQKLISLAFSHRKEEMKLHKFDLMKNIQRHVLDTGSFEARIAAVTVSIRCQQKYLRTITMRNRWVRIALKENIDARNKLLRKLRMLDYKRFEWLLDTLGITYKPAPMFVHWATRKGTLRVMTREYCNKIRKEKIDAYKSKLKSLQKDFLKEKEETFEWIKKEKEALGIKEENAVKQKEVNS